MDGHVTDIGYDGDPGVRSCGRENRTAPPI